MSPSELSHQEVHVDAEHSHTADTLRSTLRQRGLDPSSIDPERLNQMRRDVEATIVAAATAARLPHLPWPDLGREGEHRA